MVRIGAIGLAAFGLCGVTRGLAAQRTDVSSGVYLFHYQPVDLAGAVPKTEVYAAFATLDRSEGPWTVHLQLRGRDTKLRPFFDGTVWFQEAWAGYRMGATAAPTTLTFRAGKLYQSLGRFWDGSFFGNIQYFDGLKLNPQFAVEAAARSRKGAVELTGTVQYLLASDRVSGALAGRDFETLSGFEDRDGVAVRGTASVGHLTLGAGWLDQGVDTAAARYRVPHVAVDGEYTAGPFTVYVEWTRRGAGSLPAPLDSTIAGSAATLWLAGLQWHRGWLHLRYNFSRARYDRLDQTEWIHQPGVTFDLTRFIHGILEYDLWRAGGAAAGTVDRSLNAVILAEFQ